MVVLTVLFLGCLLLAVLCSLAGNGRAARTLFGIVCAAVSVRVATAAHGRGAIALTIVFAAAAFWLLFALRE